MNTQAYKWDKQNERKKIFIIETVKTVKFYTNDNGLWTYFVLIKFNLMAFFILKWITSDLEIHLDH